MYVVIFVRNQSLTPYARTNRPLNLDKEAFCGHIPLPPWCRALPVSPLDIQSPRYVLSSPRVLYIRRIRVVDEHVPVHADVPSNSVDHGCSRVVIDQAV